MQDSGSGWPLWPRWGTSLSSPDVTPATKLPSSLLRPRPEVAWLLAWDVPHPESNWAHLHSEVCTPPPQVYCPSRQVLFLSLFCWVTPNGSLFAAWAPSSSCGFPSYTLFSGGFYFQSTQYKTCPFGNSLGFFFFFPRQHFLSIFPRRKMFSHSWNWSLARPPAGVFCVLGASKHWRDRCWRGAPETQGSAPLGTSPTEAVWVLQLLLTWPRGTSRAPSRLLLLVLQESSESPQSQPCCSLEVGISLQARSSG